jgi:hypothetical protein
MKMEEKMKLCEALASKILPEVQRALDVLARMSEFDDEKELKTLRGAARESRREVLERVRLIHERAIAPDKAEKIANAFAKTLLLKRRRTATWQLGFIRYRGGGPSRRGSPAYARVLAHRDSTRLHDHKVCVDYSPGPRTWQKNP